MKIKLYVPQVVEIPDEKIPELVKQFYQRHFDEKIPDDEAVLDNIDVDDLITEAIEAGILTSIPERYYTFRDSIVR